MDILRRRVIGSGLCGAAFFSDTLAAATATTLPLLTGTSSGPSYRLGRLLAAAISRPGLAVTAIQTSGARSNLESVHSNAGTSGFCQSDLAAWAYTGTRLFAGMPGMTNLRVLANLFTASLHVLADTSTGAKTVKDLADVPTVVAVSNPADLLDAQDVFQSCGLPANAGKLVPLPANEALRRFVSNEFTVLIRTSPQRDAEIAQVVVARPNTAILGFDQSDVDKICQQQPYLTHDKIRSKQYNNGDELATVGVSCLWMTSSSLDDDVAFGAVDRLWEGDTRLVAVQACPFESLLQIDRALAGVAGVPVHTGADKFYQQHGVFIP